jgi:hypothetical protein
MQSLRVVARPARKRLVRAHRDGFRGGSRGGRAVVGSVVGSARLLGHYGDRYYTLRYKRLELRMERR